MSRAFAVLVQACTAANAVAGTVLHICGLRPMARGKTRALHRLLQRGGVSSVQVHAMTSFGVVVALRICMANVSPCWHKQASSTCRA